LRRSISATSWRLRAVRGAGKLVIEEVRHADHAEAGAIERVNISELAIERVRAFDA